jgi:DNA (cytosine-5)-methyltransferase 1
VQIRQSGVRVKKTDCFPALVAIVQTSIIASKGRYLTPRECARLQGVPDDFTFGQQSDKITYKQLGNGINADIVKMVGETLLSVFGFYFSS